MIRRRVLLASLRLQSGLRQSAFVREAMALVNLLIGSFATRADYAERAWRWAGTGALRRLASHQLESRIRTTPALPLDCARPHTAAISLSNAIITALPTARRPGLICISVESDFRRLIDAPRCRALTEDYLIYVGSAWSPVPPRLFLEGAARLGSGRLMVGISHPHDIEHIATLRPTVSTLPLLVSEWLAPQHFTPRPKEERDIDILMVAGWDDYKRHWLLFEALRQLPPSCRVTLVGHSSSQYSMAQMQRQARIFGVHQEINWLESLPVEQVNALQARARVAVQTSSREGSCVAVAEALMANTPVVVTADSHLGSSRLVNDSTGLIAPSRGLATGIAATLERHADIHPRHWMETHASCDSSLAILTQELGRRGQAPEAILPFCWRYFRFHRAGSPDPVAIGAAIAEITSRCGIVLEASSKR